MLKREFHFILLAWLPACPSVEYRTACPRSLSYITRIFNISKFSRMFLRLVRQLSRQTLCVSVSSQLTR